MNPNSPIIINGWALFCHPLFLDEVERLIEEVENKKKRDPDGYQHHHASKMLVAIFKLAFEIIPKDPSDVSFRMGKTLGASLKHWFRAKFFQQYRLFFRYDSHSKIIIYAWVNDEKHKRAYGKKSDAYHIFEKMLKRDCPPDDWQVLLKESKKI